KDSSVQLVLCGDGEEKSALEELAKELSIEKQIHFLGNRSDMKELYATSDMFVMASYREGLSRSIMEAMASGLPCVVSDIRGNRDLIEDEVGGYLLAPDDENGVAKCLKKLSSNGALRKKMGRANLDRIQEFDVAKVKDVIEKIYAEVLIGI
ncbi:MAG: glycosyltransferase, partial [Eubacteriales bacterium]|nr:glycosyltransferase [Eubacteriales bacterium]